MSGAGNGAARALVTGVGLVSPLGLSAGEHFARLLAGDSAVAPISHRDYQGFPQKLQARVPPFEVRQRIEHRLLRKILSPSAVYAVIAAGEALADAGIAPGDPERQDCGLYVGSVQLDIDFNLFAPALKESIDRQGTFDMRLFAQRGMKILDPLFLVKALPNSGLCGITIEHHVTGPNLNVTNGSVSGLQAVALAAAAIERGEIELALAGGYDSLVQLENVVEHLLAGRLTAREEEPGNACRPFDRERDGYVLGEAAGFVLLESEAHARRRGVSGYARVLGSAHTTDGAVVNGDGDGLWHAGRLALERGGTSPAELLGALFGDGLATEEDDLREAAAAARLLGESPAVLTAATGALGFTGAAAGSLSFAHALHALRHGVVPPTRNCDHPDPRCGELRFAQGPVVGDYRRALVWTRDARGKNAALVLGRAGS